MTTPEGMRIYSASTRDRYMWETGPETDPNKRIVITKINQLAKEAKDNKNNPRIIGYGAISLDSVIQTVRGSRLPGAGDRLPYVDVTLDLYPKVSEIKQRNLNVKTGLLYNPEKKAIDSELRIIQAYRLSDWLLHRYGAGFDTAFCFAMMRGGKLQTELAKQSRLPKNLEVDAVELKDEMVRIKRDVGGVLVGFTASAYEYESEFNKLDDKHLVLRFSAETGIPFGVVGSLKPCGVMEESYFNSLKKRVSEV